MRTRLPRTTASRLNRRGTLGSKGMAGSSNTEVSRFQTPASHAFANRAAVVSLISLGLVTVSFVSSSSTPEDQRARRCLRM